VKEQSQFGSAAQQALPAEPVPQGGLESVPQITDVERSKTMYGDRALRYAFGFVLVVLLLAVVSCSSSSEQAEISISSDVKEAIESAAPEQEYGFYALKTGHPSQAEDLTTMTLLVCGDDIDPSLGIMVAASSVRVMKTSLFQSVKIYFINDNMSCGGEGPCATFTETVSLSAEGIEVQLPQERFIYGNDTSEETLLAKCLKAVDQYPESVLLVKKDAGLGQQGKMVEIVFK